MPFILALDQGTSSSRSIVFDDQGTIVSVSQKEFQQIYPQPGWVEHNATEIWETQLATAQEALEQAKLTADDIAGIGITNQRETVVLWDRTTGQPVCNAIVWQDRRTTDTIAQLARDGHEPDIRNATGLVLDPYFSASKIQWMLRNVAGAQKKSNDGTLCAGTIDSWLLFNLTGGAVHATEISNASRTLLFDINTCSWSSNLLELFGVPKCILPRVVSSCGVFGKTTPDLFGSSIPVTGILGDQQAALFGQQCTQQGMAKNTYGTGCFLVANTGDRPVIGDNRLLATIAWQIGATKPTYALEGSVFTAGASIQWLRDGLKIIKTAPEVNELASQVENSGDVYFVPALAGLGAPHWDPNARGAIVGITHGTTNAHIARATLEGIAFQVAEVFNLVREVTGQPLEHLRVDGGASASDLLMQIQADILGVTIQRPAVLETTALGAACMAALGANVFTRPEELVGNRQADSEFSPQIDDAERKKRMHRWAKAVSRSRDWA